MEFAHKIKNDINNYYSKKIKEFGMTPQGVDWNSDFSQELRFAQLVRVFENKDKFSINDYGCGFGSLKKYLDENGYVCRYSGYDVSPEMIEAANKVFGNAKDCQFVCDDNLQMADYTVASGIFNVKMEYENNIWDQYLFSVLNKMNLSSKKGFSFNVLTKYSDESYVKDYLYYADPCRMFDYCKMNFSRNVALLHDYNLYEFTIIVRKL